MQKKIAVLGGGLSGLTLAKELEGVFDVTVFEKSSGVGGRLATRTAYPFEFDHGAQFFTARTDAFKEFLSPFADRGLVASWHPKIISLEAGKKSFKRKWFEPHYIAQPKMTSLAKFLADDIKIEFNLEIDRVSKNKSRWSLLSNGRVVGDGFDLVVFSVPAPQTRRILSLSDIYLDGLDDIDYLPCFTLMLGFDEGLSLNFDAALVRGSPVRWISVNSSKPGRKDLTTLVVQADNQWSRENLDLGLLEIQEILLSELESLTDLSFQNFTHIDVQRWRYAKVSSAAGRDFIVDKDAKIAACGDWCRGDRIEDAFLSGRGLAMELIKGQIL